MSKKKWVWWEAIWFGISVFLAVYLALNGTVAGFLKATRDIEFLGAFFAGFLFVSIFTAAPAGVVFVELVLSKAPLWPIVGFAGLGAMCADVLIFLFIKRALANGISAFIGEKAGGKLRSLFHYRLFRWFSVFLGALIIASPLPDEIGLALMGFSKIKKRFLIPLSFVLNGAGLLVIALAAKAIG